MSEEKDGVIEPKLCPVCGIGSNYVYRIEAEEGKESDFYRCQCGVIYQKNFPENVDNVYDGKYLDGYVNADVRQATHAVYVYAPLIEESTYGRQMLDVGMAHDHVIKEFEKRGWITYGIDRNKDLKAGGNIYKGDFETYDFNLKLTPELKEKFGDLDILPRKFDLIWMNHVLEHFKDPISALKKCYNLLSETGVLYIAVPDVDFIFKTGVAQFPHWKPNEHYVLWNETSLVRELEKIGFNIVMKRRNFSSRWMSWYDVQIIAQKRYF